MKIQTKRTEVDVRGVYFSTKLISALERYGLNALYQLSFWKPSIFGRNKIYGGIFGSDEVHLMIEFATKHDANLAWWVYRDDFKEFVKVIVGKFLKYGGDDNDI